MVHFPSTMELLVPAASSSRQLFAKVPFRAVWKAVSSVSELGSQEVPPKHPSDPYPAPEHAPKEVDPEVEVALKGSTFTAVESEVVLVAWKIVQPVGNFGSACTPRPSPVAVPPPARVNKAQERELWVYPVWLPKAQISTVVAGST